MISLYSMYNKCFQAISTFAPWPQLFSCSQTSYLLSGLGGSLSAPGAGERRVDKEDQEKA